MGPHAGQAGQQILVLRQLHLETALPGAGPLGENVQDQTAAVQHLHAQTLRQNPHLGRGQVIVEDHHGGAVGPAEIPHLLHLALADERAGVRRGTVLQHGADGLGTCRLHQGGQFLHGALVCVFLFFQDRGAQSHQNYPVTDLLCFLHSTPYPA